jgi:hypothetical protein
VYKLKKVLYGLKQAPRQWYERFTSYLLDHGCTRRHADLTLFIQRSSKNLLIAQIYVDDIVFGATNDSHAHDFASKMKKEIEMNMIGELTYFLGLPSPAIRGRNLYFTIQVCKGPCLKVWIRWQESCSHPMSTSVKICACCT